MISAFNCCCVVDDTSKRTTVICERLEKFRSMLKPFASRPFDLGIYASVLRTFIETHQPKQRFYLTDFENL